MYRYNKDYYVSKSVYECRYFIDRGFKFYDVKPSYKDPRKNVWYFKLTDELKKVIDKYHENSRKYLNKSAKNFWYSKSSALFVLYKIYNKSKIGELLEK